MSDEVSDQSILDHEVIWEQFYKGENSTIQIQFFGSLV
jgi:hypothetical protein